MSRGSIKQLTLTREEDIRAWEYALCVLKRVQTIYPNAEIAGGMIRDLLTGRYPKDIDIFIPHNRPEEGLQYLSDSGEFEGIERTIKGSARYPIDFIVGNWNNDVLPVQFIFHPAQDVREIISRFPLVSSRISFDGETFHQDKHFHFFLRYGVNLAYEDTPNNNPEYVERMYGYYPRTATFYVNEWTPVKEIFYYQFRRGVWNV